MSYEGDPHKCSECDATHKADRWNTQKAWKLGWFFKRDGTCWCPEHVPEWVTEWRVRKGVTV